jgi:hypothetical protein
MDSGYDPIIGSNDFLVIFATVFPFSPSIINAPPTFHHQKRSSSTYKAPSNSTDGGPVSLRFSALTSTVPTLASHKQGLGIQVSTRWHSPTISTQAILAGHFLSYQAPTPFT